MLLVVTLFASLVLVSAGGQVCTYIEDDTWAQVDIELNIIVIPPNSNTFSELEENASRAP